MKTKDLSVLLGLLCSLVAVNPQTFSFLRFMGTDLPNHSYVDFNLVGKVKNTGVECYSDIQCCNNADNRVADWFFPNGEKLRRDCKRFVCDIFKAY